MDNRNNQAIEVDRRETLPSSPLPEWATAEGLIPQLSACLALVRPVSMSEDAAAEWLAVAAGELAGYRRLSVEVALSDARQRCTYHGQILPHVIKYMEDANPWRMGKPLERRLPAKQGQRAIGHSPATALIEQTARKLSTRHPRARRLMTFQKMTNDIIDYRRGVITIEELRARFPTWAVKPGEAKFCVESAIAAGRVK